jgi:hypothetical protein
MYSSAFATTDITNSGGFTHGLPFCLTEHLSGSNNSWPAQNNINFEKVA